MKWVTIKLTDISRPKQWKNLPSKYLLNEGFKVYGANGVIGYYSEYNHEKPTLAITCRGATSGNIHLTEPNSYINSNAMALDNIDENKYNLRFLYYALKERGLKDVISGSAQPQITRTNLSKVELRIPESLDNQKRIARVLSDCENLITKRKESIALLDDLVKSTFLEMFGDPLIDSKWELLELKKLTSKIGSGSTPKGGKKAYKKTGISLIRSLNIYDNKFKSKNLAFIDDNQAYKLRNVIVNKNDVLINITGASVARATVVPEEVLPARVNQHVAILRVNPNKLNSQYLAYLLNSENFKKNLIKIATLGGATREALNKSQLENLMIPVPPLKFQKKFHLVVNEATNLNTLYNESLNELKNLSGVLNQLAFKEGYNFMESDPITSNSSSSVNPNESLNTEIESTGSIEYRVSKDKFGIPEPKPDRTKPVPFGSEKFEDLSIKRISEMIKTRFRGNHFSFKSLLAFLEREVNLTVSYYSSQDLNIKPYLQNKEDLKEFIFSSLETSSENATNPFLKLEQIFYNSKKENFDLQLDQKDYKKFRELEDHQKSGLYFKIIE